MATNERLTELLSIEASIPALAAGTGTSTSDVIDMNEVHEVLWVISVGTVAATGTVDFTVNSGTASGTVTTSVTGITQLTANDDNKEVLVSVRSDSLTDGHRYIAGVLARGTANSNASVVGLCRRRYRPANEHDLASVDEIVNA